MPFRKKNFEDDPDFIEPVSKVKARSYDDIRARIKSSVSKQVETRSESSLEHVGEPGMNQYEFFLIKT